MSNNKKPDQPREWSLPLTTLIVNSDFNRANGVHVIEKSTYDALQDRYEQACESDNAWRKRCEELGEENEQLFFDKLKPASAIGKLRKELAAAKAREKSLVEQLDCAKIVCDQLNRWNNACASQDTSDALPARRAMLKALAHFQDVIKKHRGEK